MGPSGRRVNDGAAPVILLTNGVVVTGWRDPDIVFDGAVAWSRDRILEIGGATALLVRNIRRRSRWMRTAG